MPESNPSDDQGRLTKARELMRGYTSQFKQPVLAWHDIATEMTQRDTEVVLVDVRTAEERAVSVVASAISQEEFLTNKLPRIQEQLRVQQGQEQGEEEPWQEKKKVLVVPYCTIGFRSGQFADKLVRDYGLPRDMVANGEGVVLFSHDPNVRFVRPGASGEHVATNRVHVFGTTWDLCASSLETQIFGMWSWLSNAVWALLRR